MDQSPPTFYFSCVCVCIGPFHLSLCSSVYWLLTSLIRSFLGFLASHEEDTAVKHSKGGIRSRRQPSWSRESILYTNAVNQTHSERDITLRLGHDLCELHQRILHAEAKCKCDIYFDFSDELAITDWLLAKRERSSAAFNQMCIRCYRRWQLAREENKTWEWIGCSRCVALRAPNPSLILVFDLFPA